MNELREFLNKSCKKKNRNRTDRIHLRPIYIFHRKKSFTNGRRRKDANTKKRLKVFTHLLDDVGHTVPVRQLDVVSSVHQALVSLQVKIPIYCIRVNEKRCKFRSSFEPNRCVCLATSHWRWYLVNEIDFGPHVDAHPGHSSNSGVHTWDPDSKKVRNSIHVKDKTSKSAILLVQIKYKHVADKRTFVLLLGIWVYLCAESG